MLKFNHPYHLVTVSPWPISMSFSLMFMMFGLIMYMTEYSLNLMISGILMSFMILFQWWRDVIREGCYQGFHLNQVLKGLRWGMLMFILSELMFFVSFFWTYFHMYLSPSVELGNFWPSLNLLIFNPYNIPLLNTMLLLSSGFSITWCHYSIINKDYLQSFISIVLTVILGMIFTFFQYLEYSESYFSISDSVYGSIFYISTGFHGLHVLMGTIFIMISLLRLKDGQFSNIHHFGFEAASWYWHFVDVVWLFLYLFIYWLSY